MKPLLELLNQLQQSNVPINMIFSSTICFIIVIFFYIARHNKAKPNFPPSPPRLPLLGNFHQLSSLPFRSLKELSDKYGPLMLVHFGCKPVVIVSSAEVAREVMKSHDLAFASRPALSMVERLMYNCDLALAPYGEYWRQVRRISVLHLLSVKRVESFRAAREEEVSVLVDKIRAASSYPPPAAGRVNLSEMIVSLTNDVISRAALGRKYSREEDAGVHDTLKEFTALMGSYAIGEFIPWFGWIIDAVKGLNARVRNNSRQVDCFLERVLDEHSRANNDRGEFSNFVDVLLALNDADDHAADNISLTRDNIKAIILDMFLGGTDTTSTAIEWTMSELIRNPEVMRRLQQEVRATVIGSCKEKVTEEDLEKMDYLKAVIKETLRLHPPLPLLIPRETIEQVELQGYEVPAGTQVLINAWTIGRDPASWDRPGEYFPERFMNTTSSASVDFRGKDFQLIPFGSGRRGCPGLGFAVAMIQVTLAHLLFHFDWELPDGMRGEALDMSEIQDVTVHRKLDLILVARPRVP